MSKRMRRLSALLMAGVMSLGSGAMASAANMSIYVREYNNQTNLFNFPLEKTPAAVVTTKDGDTIYSALKKGRTSVGSISSTWNEVTNSDGTTDQYLTSFSITNAAGVNYAATNKGGNEDPIYEIIDGKQVMTGATWKGDSWMWVKSSTLNDLAYPNETMSDVTCPTEDFSIILSYDHSEFDWGSAVKEGQ